MVSTSHGFYFISRVIFSFRNYLISINSLKFWVIPISFLGYSDDDKPLWFNIVPFSAITSAAMIAVNMKVIHSYVSKRKHLLQILHNRFLLSLSVCDLQAGMAVGLTAACHYHQVNEVNNSQFLSVLYRVGQKTSKFKLPAFSKVLNIVPVIYI